ncbi:hypothetical protein D3C78_1077570 [compost metagenome]
MRRPADGLSRGLSHQFAQEFTPRLQLAHGNAQHIKTAIGRLQRRYRHAPLLQPWRPGAVRAQARPARAAQGQHRGPRTHAHFTGRRGKAHRAVHVPAQPAVAGVEHHAQAAQLQQPGTQQRRGFHAHGKHPARSADKGFHAQGRGPGADLFGAKCLQHGFDLRLPRAETPGKQRRGLRVGQVQTALAGQQEFAPYRRHGIKQVDAHTGLRQALGRHQSGRPAADDGDFAVQWRAKGGDFSHSGFSSLKQIGASQRRRRRIAPDRRLPQPQGIGAHNKQPAFSSLYAMTVIAPSVAHT